MSMFEWRSFHNSENYSVLFLNLLSWRTRTLASYAGVQRQHKITISACCNEVATLQRHFNNKSVSYISFMHVSCALTGWRICMHFSCVELWKWWFLKHSSLLWKYTNNLLQINFSFSGKLYLRDAYLWVSPDMATVNRTYERYCRVLILYAYSKTKEGWIIGHPSQKSP